jgi:hypothetical protein
MKQREAKNEINSEKLVDYLPEQKAKIKYRQINSFNS